MSSRHSILAAAVLVLGLATTTYGSQWSDDFESYSPGSWPTRWQGWGGGVIVDPTDAANRVMRLYGSYGDASFAFGSSDFSDSFSVLARIYNCSDSRPGNWGMGSLGLRNGANYASGRTLLNFYADGTILGDGGITLGSYNTDTWYDVRVDYARAANRLSLTYFIDSELVGHTDSTIQNLLSELSLDHLELGAGSTVYYDDVVVTPEPATLSLLALGGLALIRRRRK